MTDTTALMKALTKSGTRLSKQAIAAIVALEGELAAISREDKFVQNKLLYAETVQLAKELDDMAMAHGAAVAKLAEYQARAQSAEKQHDASTQAMRDMEAIMTATGTLPPTPMPAPVPPQITDAVAFHVMVERNANVGIILGLADDFVTWDEAASKTVPELLRMYRARASQDIIARPLPVPVPAGIRGGAV